MSNSLLCLHYLFDLLGDPTKGGGSSVKLLLCSTHAHNFHLGKLRKNSSYLFISWKDMLYGICLIILISLFGKLITPNCISNTSCNQEWWEMDAVGRQEKAWECGAETKEGRPCRSWRDVLATLMIQFQN